MYISICRIILLVQYRSTSKKEGKSTIGLQIQIQIHVIKINSLRYIYICIIYIYIYVYRITLNPLNMSV